MQLTHFALLFAIPICPNDAISSSSDTILKWHKMGILWKLTNISYFRIFEVKCYIHNNDKRYLKP